MATVSLQTVFDDARRAIEAGAADKAIGIAQHILVHFPRTLEGFRLLGEAYLNDGQPEQAAAAFAQVLHADPENIAAYYGQGLALQSVEQRPAAITAFERALEIQPNLSDLRTQLLRLYSATPGSAGQFRLSRAGLGRLYARGGMFGQAIDEFRAVLDVEPERDDVKVALAEALWRDGQEDEAADFCRDVLDQHPDLIKPTVLLGYMLFANGQPEGEKLWRRAAEQDATMALAHTLFDIMPPIRIEEPVLPEFDEAEWRAQEARRAAEQAPVLAAPAQAAEDDLFADSWLSTAGSVPVQAVPAPSYESSDFAAPADTFDTGDTFDTADAFETADTSDDDLLASLLGFGDDEPPTNGADEQVAAVEPFSFDDWGAETPASAQTEAEPMPETLDQIGLADDADVGDVKPFSFDDWSFDDESGEGTQPAAATPAADSPEAETFSLDENETALPNVQPFSLDTEAEAPGVRPFSLDADEDDAPSGVQPFSFDDMDADLGVAPFAFETDTAAPAEEPVAEDAGLGNVQPFSLDEWGMDDAETNPAAAPEAAGGDEDFGAFKPFSLDELSLDSLEDDSSGALEGPQIDDATEARSDESGFSWQEPSWRSQTEEPKSPFHSEDGDTIFSKLMRHRNGEAPSTPAEASDEADSASGDVPHFFSVDDEPLRLDFDEIDRDAPTGEFADQPEELAAPEAATPTSLDEPASAESEDARLAADETTPFSLEDIAAADETFSWDADELRVDQPESDEDLVPFSLSDLGLSDEELADLDKQPDLAGERGEEETAEPSFSLSDLGLTDDELAALETDGDSGSDEAGMPAPFSFDDLGLSDDELAGLDFDRAGQDDATPASAAPVDDQTVDSGAELETGETSGADDDLVPFSLEELGLSDDEIDALDQQPDAAASGLEAADATAFAETGGSFDTADEPAEASDDELASLLADLELGEESSDDQASAPDTADNAEQNAPWLDLQSELDVERPETRTPSDFLEEAQEGAGDVDSVLETMPEQDSAAAEAAPFSLEDLGLTDEELSRLDESESPAEAPTAAEGPAEPAEDFWAAASDEQPSADESQPAEGGQWWESETAEPLPSELPEGAQPVASLADTPPVQPSDAPTGAMPHGMGAIHAQLAADPENDALRLALARMSASSNDLGQALDQYKQLIKRGHLLDDVVDDLRESIADADDPSVLRRLHRLLGDAYMKQSRFDEAMTEYSWTSRA